MSDRSDAALSAHPLCLSRFAEDEGHSGLMPRISNQAPQQRGSVSDGVILGLECFDSGRSEGYTEPPFPRKAAVPIVIPPIPPMVGAVLSSFHHGLRVTF
jgi:hypothetical protein